MVWGKTLAGVKSPLYICLRKEKRKPILHANY